MNDDTALLRHPVDGEDYSNLPMTGDRPLVPTTASGVTITYDPPPFRPAPAVTAEQKAAQEQSRAAMSRAPHLAEKSLRTSRLQSKPTAPTTLVPYLPTPEAGADLVEYIEAERAARMK